MISEELRAKVEAMSVEERRELTSYLVKLDLERDAEYWKSIRRRTEVDSTPRWVEIEAS